MTLKLLTSICLVMPPAHKTLTPLVTKPKKVQKIYDINNRPKCVCATCHTSGVFSYGAASFCEQIYLKLMQIECCDKQGCIQFAISMPHDMHIDTYRTIANFIDLRLYHHQLFDFERIVEHQQIHYTGFPTQLKETYHPLPNPFPVTDYVYHFFAFCDQFLDIPSSVWIHFVWLFNRLMTETNLRNRFVVCAHTFVPTIWAVLLLTFKLYDDHHYDNKSFKDIINFTLVQKRVFQSKLVSNSSSYENAFLKWKLFECTHLSPEQVHLCTLKDLNIFELEMIAIFDFDINTKHDRYEWPLLTCWCEQCQPFHHIYEASALFIQMFPFDLDNLSCNQSQCLLEHVRFLEMFYSRLRQTYKLTITMGIKRDEGRQLLRRKRIKKQEEIEEGMGSTVHIQ